MERSAAKELLHVQGWFARVDEIVLRGEDSYLADDLLQEAGDSLMKLGEAANRLSRMNVLAPGGVDWALAVANGASSSTSTTNSIERFTWRTLAVDLPAWRSSLSVLFEQANSAIDTD